MDKPRLDTHGSNWQAWSIRLPLGVIAALVASLWIGFNIYTQVHDNSYEVERVEGRLDKKTERLEQRVKQLEDKFRELECP